MLVRRESVVEYFKELVEGALANQHLETGELTAFYVVHLLSEFVRRPDADHEPLGPQLLAALESSGIERRAHLRRIGDGSLFISGFFVASLRRKPVDIDYYMAIGGRAYSALSHDDDSSRFSPVFAELAEKFAAFVDILSEVSERSSVCSNRDLLRLYERWVRTGGRRTAQ